MAEMGLDQRAQFAKAVMVFHDFKERIVAKAPGPGWSKKDPASAFGRTFATDRARGIGNANVTDELGAAILYEHMAQGLQQFLIIANIRGIWTAVTGRKHSGRATQGIYRKAAVVGQNPMAEMAGLLCRLQGGVGRKGIAVFHDVDGLWKIGQRASFQTGTSQQLGKFLTLLTIAGA
jgi:hypothetical protein